MDIIIRQVQNSDFDELLALYESIWGNVDYNKSDKLKFLIESRSACLIAESDKKIIGSRMSMPIHLYEGHKPLHCIQVCDTCTAPSYRGKGVMGSLNKTLLSEFFVVNKGDVIFNVGEFSSRSVNEKYGWQYINSFGTLVQFTRPFHIFAKVGHHIGVVGGNDGWEAGDKALEVPKRFLEVRKSVMQMSNVLHVNYDQQTLDWRIKTNSGIKCFVDDNVGAVIYKVRYTQGLTIVLIGEMFPAEYSQKAFNELLNAFKKSINPDAIKCIISLGHPLYKFYRRKCFLPNFGRKFLNHGVRVETDEMKQICYEPMNWAISMLDIDTF